MISGVRLHGLKKRRSPPLKMISGFHVKMGHLVLDHVVEQDHFDKNLLHKNFKDVGRRYISIELYPSSTMTNDHSAKM